MPRSMNAMGSASLKFGANVGFSKVLMVDAFMLEKINIKTAVVKSVKFFMVQKFRNYLLISFSESARKQYFKSCAKV